MLTIKPFPILAAVLAAFATSALAQSDNHGNGHAQLHNARIETDGRETGDCEPTQARVRDGHWEAWVRQIGRWQKIPDEKIISQRNPSIFDAHLCWTPWRGTICFVPPDTGG
jgi:hypothetical protein